MNSYKALQHSYPDPEIFSDIIEDKDIQFYRSCTIFDGYCDNYPEFESHILLKTYGRESLLKFITGEGAVKLKSVLEKCFDVNINPFFYEKFVEEAIILHERCIQLIRDISQTKLKLSEKDLKNIIEKITAGFSYITTSIYSYETLNNFFDFFRKCGFSGDFDGK